MSSRPEGTIRCILCKGFVSFVHMDRFQDHMQHEHRTYFHTEFLLEACKLLSVNPADFGVIRTIMQGMYEENLRSIVAEEEETRSNVYREKEDSINNSADMDSSGSLEMSASLSLQEREGSSSDIFPAVDYEEVEEEEKESRETPDSYSKIPSHLIDEFEKLCDNQRNKDRKDKEKEEETRKSSRSLFTSSISESRKSSSSLFSSASNTLRKAFKQEETKLGPVKMFADGKVDFPLNIMTKEEFENKLEDVDESKDKSKSKPFECNMCSKQFQLNFLLKKHIQTNHSDEVPKKGNVCPFCKKTFKFSLLLKRHVQFKHKDKEPQENRDDANTNKSADDTINYPCEICGRAFSQSGNMKRHMKTIHDDKALYNCENCGKHFTNITSLQMHKASHSGCRKKSPSSQDRVYVESLV